MRRAANAEFVSWGVAESPPCGCKGKHFLGLDRVGDDYFLTCLHCEATWQGRIVEVAAES